MEILGLKMKPVLALKLLLMKQLAVELLNLKMGPPQDGVEMEAAGTKTKLAREPRRLLTKKVVVPLQTIYQVLYTRAFQKLNVMMGQITCLTRRELRAK